MTINDVVACYTLQVLAPKGLSFEFSDSYLREIEENITDLLPNGWTVIVQPWDGYYDERNASGQEDTSRV